MNEGSPGQEAVGSPLGLLDPSKITNMVVDQVGLHQQKMNQYQANIGEIKQVKIEPDTAMSSGNSNYMSSMDQPSSHSGTPTSNGPGTGIMQQGISMGSPALSSGQPMTPQSQSIQPPQTPGGLQYAPQEYQQPHSQFSQHQPHQSPASHGGTPVPPQMNQNGNEEMFNQQRMQQQQMFQQGMTPGSMHPNQQQFNYQHQQAQQAQWAAQQQQQQMMQQSHFARQNQMMVQQGGGQQPQRVMMPQRIPYPQAQGYPNPNQPGMPPQPGTPGGTNQFAQRPPGSQANTPGGGAPRPQSVAYPQGSQPVQPPTPQYPQYPNGAQVPPQQFQQQYPNQPMYQQRPPIGPPMRQYISPQGSMSNQGFAGSGQPTTPQTPQPPFTPNGSRFPQPTPSPHFNAELRSPPLMSPSQQPMSGGQPPGLVRPGEMVVHQPMRMPPTPVMAPLVGYHPEATPSADMCLTGCIIQVFDIDRFSTDKTDLMNVSQACKLRGGDVEFGQKTFADRNPALTHVVVDNYRNAPFLTMIPVPNFGPVPSRYESNQLVRYAANERKRVVTLHWLFDSLNKKAMEPPSKLSHLPSCFSNDYRPYSGKYFSVSGFDESERASLKWIIECTGAKMTPYLSRQNTVLIAKTVGVEKVIKAREWNIPVVNFLWLAELYAGLRPPDREDFDSGRYQVGAPCCEVNCGHYNLEMMCEPYKAFLSAWQIPVRLTTEQFGRAVNVKDQYENDPSMFLNRHLRSALLQEPSEEEIHKMHSEQQNQRKGKVTVFVAFNGIEDDIRHNLAKKLRYLGGVEVDNVADCTHLVSLHGCRTAKLLEAIVLGRNIVKPAWIEHGYQYSQFLDTLDYFLRDEDSEKSLGYNCKRSVVRARNKPVFEDVTFYVTHSVDPSRSLLVHLITQAGGRIDEERPDPMNLIRCIETDALYVIISCDADLKQLEYLVETGFPIFSTEFVLMSLLRQEMEAHKLYRLAIPSANRPPQMRGIPRHPQPQPHEQQPQPMQPRLRGM